MKLIRQITVNTIELPDQLQFIAVRENGWIDLIMPPAVLFGVLVYALLVHQWVWILFVAIGFASIVAWHLNGPVTRLFVNQSEMIARGNLHRTLKNEIIVSANEIKSIGYWSGGENDPTGLYAHRNLRSVCILPGLNKQQASEVAEAIHIKFPSYEINSTLHFSPSLSITLDL